MRVIPLSNKRGVTLGSPRQVASICGQSVFSASAVCSQTNPLAPWGGGGEPLSSQTQGLSVTALCHLLKRPVCVQSSLRYRRAWLTTYCTGAISRDARG